MESQTSSFVARLRGVLPSGWFGAEAPVLDSVLAGPANGWSRLHALMEFARAQLRVASATGAGLDAIAADFLGNRVKRRLREQDDHLRTRVQQELLRERTTRAALRQVLVDMTGREPVIFEPAQPRDTGAYGPTCGALAYGLAGGWGSLDHPFQVFVTALRPGLDSAAYGQGWGGGAYNANLTAYANLEAARAGVTDDDIARATRDALPAAAIAWLRIAG